MNRVVQLFENESKTRAESNRPFLLNKPGRGWFICEGRMEVFSVRVEHGNAAGALQRPTLS